MQAGHAADVSICIPTFNGAKFLSDTLRSVEAQDFAGRIEVIISDDGSTDGTARLVEAFAAASRFPCRIVRNGRRGIGRNWNNCIAHARGTYVKLLMQDDIIYPDHLSAMVAAFEAHPDVGMVFARRDILAEGDHQGWIDRYGCVHEGWSRPIGEGPVSGRALLGDANFLSDPKNKIGEPSTVLLRRAAIRRTGRFSTELVQALDYEYWYRLMARHDIYFIDRPLSAFRRHEGQASVVNGLQNYDRGGRETVPLYRSYIANIFRFVTPQTRYVICRRVFGHYLGPTRLRAALRGRAA